MRVSEIRVKRIRVNQGLGVLQNNQLFIQEKLNSEGRLLIELECLWFVLTLIHKSDR